MIFRLVSFHPLYQLINVYFAHFRCSCYRSVLPSSISINTSSKFPFLSQHENNRSTVFSFSPSNLAAFIFYKEKKKIPHNHNKVLCPVYNFVYIYVCVCVCVLLQPIYYNSTSRSINETETKAVPVHRACNGGIRHVNLGALGVVPWLTPKLHSHCPLEPPWHEERSLPCARESRASAYSHDGVRGICD